MVIWIATSFSAEHIAAFEWLNRTTTVEVGFYAVQVELLRIGDSALAPYFQPLVRPNEVAKAASATRQVTDWGWATYDSELHLPMHRIALAKRIVDSLTAAIEARQRPCQMKIRKGYVAFQRTGGYNVMVVDLVRNRPVRLAIKLPSGQDPDSLELTSLFPQVSTVWDASAHEWGWHIESAEEIPNPEFVVSVADRYAAGAPDESSEEG